MCRSIAGSFQSISAAAPALSSKPAARRCCCQLTGRTDRRTDPRSLHRRRSHAGSAKNGVWLFCRTFTLADSRYVTYTLHVGPYAPMKRIDIWYSKKISFSILSLDYCILLSDKILSILTISGWSTTEHHCPPFSFKRSG